MRHGITPRHFKLFGKRFRYTDHRDLDYHRSFGSVAVQMPLATYNYDAGFGMPDQDAEGYPNGCTGYTQTEVAQDIDHLSYDPAYTYNETLKMSGLPDNSPCDIRVSMKSTVVYGLQERGKINDGDIEHRQGPYLNVRKVAGMDWFDSIRLALRNNPNRSLSLGTPWFPEWESTPSTGIVTSIVTGNPDTLPWHDHKSCGETVIGGLPYLIDKSWQGTRVGDRGWLYLGRDTINALLEISGTEVFIRRPLGSADPKFVQLEIFDAILAYIGRLITVLFPAHV